MTEAARPDPEAASEPLASRLSACFERLTGSDEPVIGGAVRALCRALESGHLCVDVGEVGEVAALRACGLAGGPQEKRPLVLDERGRLYFRRYWWLESRLARQIRARLAPAAATVTTRLAAGEADPEPVAVMAACVERAGLTLVSGGPGTGKTTSVFRLLERLGKSDGMEPERTALVASTGKAAARLRQAMEHSSALEARARAVLRGRVSTVHALLGPLPGSPRFRHGPENPLTVGLLVVDEASMVDLALLTRLLEALPVSAKVILLGDADQLASVEAGAAFGLLAGLSRPGTLDVLANDRGPAVTAGPVLSQAAAQTVWLTRNYRFGGNEGLARFCEAVRSGRTDTAMASVDDAASPDLTLHTAGPGGPMNEPAFRRFGRERVRALLGSATPEEALERLERHRFLCALRRGPFGAEGVNARLLAGEGIDPGRTLPDGLPVVVLRNAPRLGLANGDSGVIWNHDGAPRLILADNPDGEVPRSVALSAVPAWDVGFALTVHRSQGSEFDEVDFVLPPEAHPLLTRELCYTAVSRARARARIWGAATVLRAGLEQRVERRSGLLDRLVERD